MNVRLAAAVAALMTKREVDRAERLGDLPPGMGNLLRQMRMTPSELGRGRRQEVAHRNSRPEQGARERERRQRQLARKATP